LIERSLTVTAREMYVNTDNFCAAYAKLPLYYVYKINLNYHHKNDTLFNSLCLWQSTIEWLVHTQIYQYSVNDYSRVYHIYG
jgi:hypothetical protein